MIEENLAIVLAASTTRLLRPVIAVAQVRVVTQLADDLQLQRNNTLNPFVGAVVAIATKGRTLSGRALRVACRCPR